MIIHQDGRSRSVRTPQEELEDLFREFDSLNEEERVALEAVLHDLMAGDHEMYSALADAEFEYPPVDVETFLRDDYFLGQVGKQLYPKLMDDMVELFEGGYSEAIMTGSIGFGKSFFATLAQCYIYYQISCLRDPQRSYGIDSGSWISFANISVNEKTARRVVFNEIKGKLERSPYFRERFPFKPYWIELQFRSKNLMVVAGSTTSNSIIGMNIFGGNIDEACFLGRATAKEAQGGSVVDRAQILYAAIMRRMKSRYMKTGKLPGILFITSSASTLTSFVQRRIAESVNDPTVFVRDYATWSVKRKRDFSQNRFHVLVGSSSSRSRILSDNEDHEALGKIQGVRVLDVPEDYRTDFERDLEGSIRDIGGMSTVARGKYIHRIEKIDDMVDKLLVHPFTTEVHDLDSPGEFIWERLAHKTMRTLPGGFKEEAWVPVLNPGVTRYVGLDPSKTGDCTGFAMGHISTWCEVVRRDAKGKEYNEIAPVIILDVVLRVVPPVGDEIIMGDLRALIYQLVTHGFSVGYAATDSWQAVETCQKLRQKGITAEVNSVDKDTKSYDSLKTALYEDRLKCYRYEPLISELKELELHLGGGRTRLGKVDHPDSGSKDVSDAVAQVVYALTTRLPGVPVAPEQGISEFPTNGGDGDNFAWVTGGATLVEREGERGRGRSGEPPIPFLTG